jgi:hypothetical protein
MNRIGMLLLLSGMGMAATAATPKVDLTGVVRSEDGTALAGARVYIHAAAPKDDARGERPASELDCEKSAGANDAGRFRIEKLDAGAVFTVLAAAAGHKYALVDDVDPSRGDVSIVLRRRSDSDFESPADIVGMVLDPGGRPVSGAVVEVTKVVPAGRTVAHSDAAALVDPVGIADGQGRFVLRCEDGVFAVQAMAHGPRVARRHVRLLPGKDQFVRMEEGSRVTGRIELDGRPVEGAVAFLSPPMDSVTTLAQIERATTDADGYFDFRNVPANQAYTLLATMESLAGRGAVVSRQIQVGNNNSEVDAGRLLAEQGLRLAGRIEMANGDAIPPELELFLGRETAFDLLEIPVEPDGSFAIADLPGEALRLILPLEAYRVSSDTPYVDENGRTLRLEPKHDITNLVVRLEPR